MSKAEWGSKRICPACSKPYYDMKKNPPVCPGCKTAYDPETLSRAKRGRADKKVALVKPAEEIIDDLPVADVGAEDAIIEDAEELADDDEMDEVVEVAEEA